jgi:hypothetical protein
MSASRANSSRRYLKKVSWRHRSNIRKATSTAGRSRHDVTMGVWCPWSVRRGDLAKAQLAAEETDALVCELVGDALAVEDGGAGREAPPRQATEAALAVGEEVEPCGDEIGEELGAPAAAVEDHGDAALPYESADLLEQLGKHRDHAGVRVGGDDEERLPPGVVRPVVGGRRKGDAHPGHVRLRDVALAVMDAHVAVDVEEAERGAEGRDATLGGPRRRPRSTGECSLSPSGRLIRRSARSRSATIVVRSP